MTKYIQNDGGPSSPPKVALQRPHSLSSRCALGKPSRSINLVVASRVSLRPSCSPAADHKGYAAAPRGGTSERDCTVQEIWRTIFHIHRGRGKKKTCRTTDSIYGSGHVLRTGARAQRGTERV